ncbi:MAG: bacteriohemerythrin [Deltaproteobacteria bacterium]|nr:bacteriohemerythrin [Deltaproteobacteria bacterium]
MAIKWDESWNTNIAVIDQQHRKLLNLVNDLSDAMRVGKSKDVMADVLTVLVNYTKTHFSAEERLMTQAKYDDLAGHKKEHDGFVEKINSYAEKVKAGSSAVSIEMMSFLSSWIIQHIKGTDMKYVPALQAKRS